MKEVSHIYVLCFNIIYVLKSIKNSIKVIRFCSRLEVFLKIAALKFYESTKQELYVEITLRKAVKSLEKQILETSLKACFYNQVQTKIPVNIPVEAISQS